MSMYSAYVIRQAQSPAADWEMSPCSPLYRWLDLWVYYYQYVVPSILLKLSSYWCVTNTDCRLADWQVNVVKIVMKCFNRFLMPKL